MSFAQTEYLPFLVICLCLFQFVPAQRRVLFLLLSSYTFYLWIVPAHGVLLLASTAVDFGVAQRIHREQRPRARRNWLRVSLAFNVGLLCLFKFAGGLLEGWNVALRMLGEAPREWTEVVLPLGISFYTFQTLSYTIDVYRQRQEPCRDPILYGLYVSFFPQLVAGPIERARHLLPQLSATVPLSAANFSLGGRLILWGLIKKWVCADRLLAVVWPVFSDPASHGCAALLITAVTLFVILYLDFSGYTDIARGSARLFGVDLVRNFEGPFLETSLPGLLRKWHMSLMSWMIDYVYVPFFKGRPTHRSLWTGNIVTMVLFGLWHGGAWTFFFWGLAWGIAVSVQHSMRLLGFIAPKRKRPLRALVGWLVTVFTGSQFIVFFFAPDLSHALQVMGRQFTGFAPEEQILMSYSLPLLGVLALLLFGHGLGRLVDLPRAWERSPFVLRAALIALGVAALVLYRVPEARPFIYFRF